MDLKSLTTLITSPQINRVAERFVRTLKRDYANLANRQESKVEITQLNNCFYNYNKYNPISALGYWLTNTLKEK